MTEARVPPASITRWNTGEVVSKLSQVLINLGRAVCSARLRRGRRRRAERPPATDIPGNPHLGYWDPGSSRGHAVAVAPILIMALAVQLGLYRVGLYRVTADESARSLLALGLSWHNALQPWVWPPFYKIFVGLFLDLHRDVFIVPRVLVGIAGLLVLLLIFHLAHAVSADRKVSLIAALLALPNSRSPDLQRHPDVRHLLLSAAGRGRPLHPALVADGPAMGAACRLRLPDALLDRPVRRLVLLCHTTGVSGGPKSPATRRWDGPVGSRFNYSHGLSRLLDRQFVLVVWLSRQSLDHK